MARSKRSFADYKTEGDIWVTLATGEYYPDIVFMACELYEPVLRTFGRILKSSISTIDLYVQISEVPESAMRIQLLRVFRRYVAPNMPVEMLKKKTKAKEIGERYGQGFRGIAAVQSAFSKRTIPDEALCALLWENKDRGQRGYDLTERMFIMLKGLFPTFDVIGPVRAGRDLQLGKYLADYPNPKRPVDFMILKKGIPLAIGLTRYDSDRGGSQEDDRTGNYRDVAHEILQYADKKGLSTKVIFVNDGPGLLLGSMWDDYSRLEEAYPERVKVVTMRMAKDRITKEWLLAED